MKHIQKIFDDENPDKMSFFTKVKILLFVSFPGLLNTVRKFYPETFQGVIGWLRELAGKMIQERLSTGEVRPDYIQLMLDSLNEN